MHVLAWRAAPRLTVPALLVQLAGAEVACLLPEGPGLVGVQVQRLAATALQQQMVRPTVALRLLLPMQPRLLSSRFRQRQQQRQLLLVLGSPHRLT